MPQATPNETHKYSHFTIAYKWIIIHSTYSITTTLT